MAEAGSYESILENGLLSTTALLDLFEVSGEERMRIESRRRPEMVELTHPEHGSVFVRDNKPINEAALAKCLMDMSLGEWYEALNQRVFFWVDRRRLEKLLGAKAYRGREHLVLELDARNLIECHHERISLSTLNSGAAFPLGAPPRGSQTFRPLSEFPLRKPVVELTVDYAVSGIKDLIVGAHIRG